MKTPEIIGKSVAIQSHCIETLRNKLLHMTDDRLDIRCKSRSYEIYGDHLMMSGLTFSLKTVTLNLVAAEATNWNTCKPGARYRTLLRVDVVRIDMRD